MNNVGSIRSSRWTRYSRSLAVLVGGLLALLLVTAPAAAAHATVVSSTPADGARLAGAPSTVTVTFDEAVGLNGVGYLRVVDQTGRDVDAGPASHPGGDATQIATTLKTGLGDGTYTASFRVISADSHPVAGVIRFVVGTGALVGGAGGTPSSVNSTTSAVFDVVRWLTFAGLDTARWRLADGHRVGCRARGLAGSHDAVGRVVDRDGRSGGRARAAGPVQRRRAVSARSLTGVCSTPPYTRPTALHTRFACYCWGFSVSRWRRCCEWAGVPSWHRSPPASAWASR